MHPIILAGGPDEGLAAALGAGDYPVRLLVNADRILDVGAIVARCEAFVAGGAGLIVTLLPWAAPGLGDFAVHAAVASLWAFTRQAALEWAPLQVRVNAVGLGVAPFGPFEAADQSGRGAAEILAAAPATFADIARTVRAMAEFPSMTGQIIRLGV